VRQAGESAWPASIEQRRTATDHQGKLSKRLSIDLSDTGVASFAKPLTFARPNPRSPKETQGKRDGPDKGVAKAGYLVPEKRRMRSEKADLLGGGPIRGTEGEDAKQMGGCNKGCRKRSEGEKNFCGALRGGQGESRGEMRRKGIKERKIRRGR